MKNLFILCCLAATLEGNAQKQYFFKSYDLAPGSYGSYPAGFIELNKKLIFVAETKAHGPELWSSDGTAMGTKMVKDIFPGDEGSYPYNFMEMNGKLYFIGRDTVSNYELWSTDGTSQGTKMVKDIRPVLPGVTNAPKIVYNNQLLFIANDGTTGDELWSTDGTGAGTKLVKDINPGVNASYPSNSGKFTLFNNKVYFSAGTSAEGQELWVTDGTAGGTIRVKDIRPGTAGSWPSNLVVMNNKLYFIADDGVNGDELWVTDGTEPGTQLVTDLYPGQPYGVYGLVSYANNLLIIGNNGSTGVEFFISDGTAGGTKLLKDINPGTTGSGIAVMGIYKSNTYFVADDGTSGAELWVTDGTTAGTQMVQDVLPGQDGSLPRTAIVFNDELYFTAQQTPGDYQLFKTDGTTAGTSLVPNPYATEINPLQYSSDFYVYDSVLYFSAVYDTSGRELWMLTDDTTTTVPGNVTAASKETEVMLYPNPSKGNFTIKLLHNDFRQGSVYVYDVSGELVYTRIIENENDTMQISLGDVPAGNYLLQLWLDDKLYAKKFVVK